MVDGKEVVKIALESGVTGAAILDTSDIEFHEEFREACEKNVCGKFNTRWMGPPAIGPIRMLRKRVMKYRHGLLIQTVHPPGRNFNPAAANHQEIFRALVKNIRSRYPDEEILALSAGCCSFCERCTYPDGRPCRHPDQALSSVEAYGMNVLSLAKKAGLHVYHGKSTLCFVGLILFNR